MKTSSSLFLVTALSIAFGMFYIFSLAQSEFGEATELRLQLNQEQQLTEQERLKADLLANQLYDFRQDTARLLSDKTYRPSVLAEFNQKQILDSIRLPASEASLSSSDLLLAKAKQDFREGRYKLAAAGFANTIYSNPGSASLIEAHFLLAESYFMSGQIEESISIIEVMMLHFPDSEMTGYALLRFGQILEVRRRPLEAREVYLSVQKHFSNDTRLRQQASLLMKNVEQ